MQKINFRFPGGKAKAFTISYDDNTTGDARLIKKMEEYGIKGTFNIIASEIPEEEDQNPKDPTYVFLSYDHAKELYSKPIIEPANHGYTHKWMQTVPATVAMEDIVKCRMTLEKMFGEIITGFAYPYGTYNDKLKEIIGMAGITYARTVCSTREFDLPTDWLELNPTCHHDDPELKKIAENFVNLKPENEPKMFYLWGHTFEFDRNDNWELVDEFFDMIGGHDDIWYATNGEICSYCNVCEKLQYSADSSIIHNPTDKKIWMEIDNILVTLEPGETYFARV